MKPYTILEQLLPVMKRGEYCARFREVGVVQAKNSSDALVLGRRLTKHPITTADAEDYRRLRLTL